MRLTDKNTARKQAAEKRKRLSKEEIRICSEKIREILCRSPEYKAAGAVYAYAACNNEVETAGIIRQALFDKKRVALPKVLDRETMEFVYINSEDDLEAGYMNIPEPKESLLNEPGRIAHEKSALVIVPGLAFDKKGNRAGYGAGFYDRYFAAHPESCFTKIAPAYDFQIYDELDAGPYDIGMDKIITPQRIITV